MCILCSSLQLRLEHSTEDQFFTHRWKNGDDKKSKKEFSSGSKCGHEPGQFFCIVLTLPCPGLQVFQEIRQHNICIPFNQYGVGHHEKKDYHRRQRQGQW